jgi:hypothetical protein
VDPWSGWHLRGEVERGSVGVESFAIGTVARQAVPGTPPSYTRAFLDMRRYNRLSPNAQINFRVVTGGWVGGDPLPMQRRLSVDGPGAMPGFGFRNASATTTDVGACNVSISAAPVAECERIALAQVEFRAALHIGAQDHWNFLRETIGAFNPALTWVLFTDVGRGWLVGSRAGEMRYGRYTLPPISTFRTDFGAGVDLGGFGVYAARALSPAVGGTRLFIRVKRRV